MPVSQRLTLPCVFEPSDVVVLETATVYEDGCPLPKGTPLVRVCINGDPPFVEPPKLILAALSLMPDAQRAELVQRILDLPRPTTHRPPADWNGN